MADAAAEARGLPCREAIVDRLVDVVRRSHRDRSVGQLAATQHVQPVPDQTQGRYQRQQCFEGEFHVCLFLAGMLQHARSTRDIVDTEMAKNYCVSETRNPKRTGLRQTRYLLIPQMIAQEEGKPDRSDARREATRNEHFQSSYASHPPSKVRLLRVRGVPISRVSSLPLLWSISDQDGNRPSLALVNSPLG
jgi:hypothetical protein